MVERMNSFTVEGAGSAVVVPSSYAKRASAASLLQSSHTRPPRTRSHIRWVINPGLTS